MSLSKKPKVDSNLDDIRAQFHMTLNGTLRFDDLTRGSEKRVWWRCEAPRCCETEHIWETGAYSRLTLRTGCPFCCNRNTCRCKSLGARFPDIAAQIDGDIDPFGVSAFSNKILTFRCTQSCCATEHVWATSVCNRTSQSQGCPFCSGKRACRCKSLGSKHPEIAAQLVDKTVDVFSLTPHARAKYTWECTTKACDCHVRHVWESTVDQRTHGRGCPWCCKPRKRVCCETLSSRFPEIASELVDDVDPSSLSMASGKTFTWRCSTKTCDCDVDHVWTAAVSTRTSGKGCPWCAGNHAVCPCRSLAVRFPDIAGELADKTIDPYQISAKTGKTFRFRCTTKSCNCPTVHEWETLLTDRTVNGAGCPFCSGRLACACKSLLHNFPDVALSLADPSIDASTISMYSNKPYEWRCDAGRGHPNWTTVVSSRSNGSGCPLCRTNKAEAAMETILTDHPRVAEHWKRAMECEDPEGRVRMLTPDACGRTASGGLFAVELDGPQHFDSVDHFGPVPTDFRDQVLRDMAKNRTLWKQGYSLLRVSHLEYGDLEGILVKFIDDVDTTGRQILRTSNNDKYKDLQERAKAMLEGKSD